MAFKWLDLHFKRWLGEIDKNKSQKNSWEGIVVVQIKDSGLEIC